MLRSHLLKARIVFLSSVLLLYYTKIELAVNPRITSAVVLSTPGVLLPHKEKLAYHLLVLKGYVPFSYV